MMKLSEIQNEDALDVLADLLDPISKMAVDKSLREALLTQGKMAFIKSAIKNHKSETLEILAILEGVPISEYKVSLIQIPIKLTELLNDEDLLSFFQSQGLKISNEYSGSATENTEAGKA